MVHDILTTNKWDRPIFFSTTSAPDARIGLDAYMWMEGLAFHFKPVRAGGTSSIDIPMMKKNFLAENVLPSQGYQTGYLFRNTNDATVALDENEQRMLMNYRVGFMRIADYFMRAGDDKQEAKRVLQKMEEKLPLAVVPTQQWSYTNYVAKLFYELGDREHFQQYATVVEGKCLELINAGPVVSTDPSSNPYVVLAELYGMRKEYEKGIGMLRKLATQYPNTPWINGQIRQYEELLRGSVSADSARQR